MERPDFFSLKNGSKSKLPFSNKEYEERLKKIRRGKHIKDFEADFTTQYSPVIQAVTVGIYKKEQSYLGKDAKVAKAYGELLEFAKEVAGLGPDMITQTGSSFKVKKVDRRRLSKIFRKRARSLRDLAQVALQSHYDQILYLRSSSN